MPENEVKNTETTILKYEVFFFFKFLVKKILIIFFNRKNTKIEEESAKMLLGQLQKE